MSNESPEKQQQNAKQQQINQNVNPPLLPYPETVANFLARVPKPLPKLEVKPVTTRKLNPLPPMKTKLLPVPVSKTMPVLVPVRPVPALVPIRPSTPIAPTSISIAPIAKPSAVTPCSKSVPIRNLKPVMRHTQLKATAERKKGTDATLSRAAKR